MITTIIGISNTTKHSNKLLQIEASTIDNGVGIGIVTFQVLLAFMTGKFKNISYNYLTNIFFLFEGGRIWWISHEARKLMGKATHRKYKAIVAIMYV